MPDTADRCWTMFKGPGVPLPGPGGHLLQIYYSVQPLIKGSSGWGQETPRRAGVAGGALMSSRGWAWLLESCWGRAEAEGSHPTSTGRNQLLLWARNSGPVCPALSLLLFFVPEMPLGGDSCWALTRATGCAGRMCPTAGTVLLCPCPRAWPLGAHGSRKSALGGHPLSPRGVDPVTGLLTLPHCSSRPSPVFCNRSSGFHSISE